MQKRLVWLLIALHGILTLWLASRLNIWIDEAYSIQTTGQGLSYAAIKAVRFELQPPFYFLLLNVWRQVDHSYLFARVLSVACTTTTIYFIYLLARRLAPSINPALVVVAAAFNPFLIWAAVEIRVYALVILLSSVLMSSFISGYLQDVDANRSRWLYSVVALAGLYTQYYIFFAIVANGLFLLTIKRHEALKAYVRNVMPALVAFLPMIAILWRQIPALRSAGEAAPTLFANVRSAASILSHYLIAVFHGPAWMTSGVPVIAAISIATLLIVKRKQSNPRILFGLYTTFVTLALLVPAMTVVGQPAAQRYFALVFVPCLVGTFAIITLANRLRWLAAFWCLMIVASGLASDFAAYKPLAKPGDWQRVATYIQQHEAKGQPILVFWSYAKLPFDDYYAGLNNVVAVPAEPNLTTYDVQAAALENSHQVRRLAAGANSVWLVNTDYCGTSSVNLHCDLLARDIASHYRIISKRAFFHNTVRLLQDR